MKSYSFANITALVNGVQVSGFAEGDGVLEVEFPDAATPTYGADGGLTLSLHAQKSMTSTLKLAQTSKGNKIMMGLAAAQRGGTASFIPLVLLVKDSYRNDIINGARGFFKKVPKITRGVKENEVAWEMEFERGDIGLGDPTFAGLATAIAEAAGAG
jgi:Protein of unknown function (DUF3277)